MGGGGNRNMAEAVNRCRMASTTGTEGIGHGGSTCVSCRPICPDRPWHPSTPSRRLPSAQLCHTVVGRDHLGARGGADGPVHPRHPSSRRAPKNVSSSYRSEEHTSD